MKISAPGIAVAFSLVLFGAPLRAQAVPDSVRRFIEQAEARAVEAAMRGDFAAMSAMYADPSMVQTAGSRWKKAGGPRFEIWSVEVRGDLAVESGRVGGADYISVWTRQPDGGWKISRDVWGSAARVLHGVSITAPAPDLTPRVASSATPVAPSAEEFIPIPDARSLSDGFVRTIQDDLRSAANRLRSLSGSEPEKRRKVAAKADHDFRGTIRDVGWIDIGRFGVRASCDAAYIVSQSGDLALMRATLPLMEKNLKNSAEGGTCFQSALEAYQALASR